MLDPLGHAAAAAAVHLLQAACWRLLWHHGWLPVPTNSSITALTQLTWAEVPCSGSFAALNKVAVEVKGGSLTCVVLSAWLLVCCRDASD